MGLMVTTEGVETEAEKPPLPFWVAKQCKATSLVAHCMARLCKLGLTHCHGNRRNKPEPCDILLL
jgi:hypothetical protein